MPMVTVETKKDRETDTSTVIFKLQAGDGLIVTVEKDVVFRSTLIRNMATDLNLLDSSMSQMLLEPLPIANVEGEVLTKLMEWCAANKDKEWQPKGPTEDPIIVLTQEDQEYLDVKADFLLKMMMGASYLDIEPIVDIIAQKIANMAIGKTTEEIRQIYGLPNDLSPEEEAAIKIKYAWLDEM